MVRRVVSVASLILALAGCSADAAQPAGKTTAAPVPVTVSGAVQKGPFLLGSSVTVTPVSTAAVMAGTTSSAALGAGEAGSKEAVPASPEGQVFKTETSSDRGEFSVQLTYQGPATIEANGFYYNEASGDLSTAPITLRALTQVGESDSTSYVNLITHLTYQRVRNLIAGGATYADASAQAESELQAELGFGDAPAKAASETSLEGGDDESDAYLFAVSAVFAQASVLDAGGCGRACVDSKLQELLNATSATFAVAGTLSVDTKTKLVQARATINNADVETALAARFAKTGSVANVPSLDRVIPWSIPKSVSDCASTVDASVSMQCRLAVCGVEQRPLTQSDLQGLQREQGLVAASECGADCWKALACVVQNCTVVADDGRRTVNFADGSCSFRTCDVGAARIDDVFQMGTFSGAQLDQLLRVHHHECDADLGLAK